MIFQCVLLDDSGVGFVVFPSALLRASGGASNSECDHGCIMILGTEFVGYMVLGRNTAKIFDTIHLYYSYNSYSIDPNTLCIQCTEVHHR